VAAALQILKTSQTLVIEKGDGPDHGDRGTVETFERGNLIYAAMQQRHVDFSILILREGR